MGNTPEIIVTRRVFLLSIALHCLILSIPSFDFSPSPKIALEKEITIEIESLPLLPKIDVMAEEKKLKEIEPLPEEPELESEPEEALEEISVEEDIKILNPEDEAMLRYQDMIKQRIESCRRYPAWAKEQGFEGIAHLVFTLLPGGAAQNIKIIQFSGYNVLDREAVSTVKRASPFPPIPKNFNCPSLAMDVSIVFTLK